MLAKKKEEFCYTQLSAIPEKAMFAACLERALLDSCGNTVETDKHGALRHNARHWIVSWSEEEADNPALLTFPWVCSLLEFCPFRLRREMRKLWDLGGRPEHTRYDWADIIAEKLRTTATGAEVYYY